MSRTAHYYHKGTGIFSGRSISSSVHEGFERLMELNAPPDHAGMEGVRDHLTQKVNLFTGELVEYRAERPSRDHEWNHSSRRWELNLAAARRQAERPLRLARIADLQSQAHDLVCALVLKEDQATRASLAQIHTQIAALRADL